MGKNSRKRRRAKRRAAQIEAIREEEKKQEIKSNNEKLIEANSRLLPFQWIPKFNLAARTAMSNYYWNRLSKTLRERADYVCAYCGERHPEPYGTALHEEWEYIIKKVDDKWIGTFKLKTLKCVCKNCHNVCHPGAAAYFEGKGIDEVIERYCNVNNVDEDKAYEEFLVTKIRRDILAKNVSEWKLEDDILDKIENEYGVVCYSKNVQF